MTTVAACLLLIYYRKLFSSFYVFLSIVAEWQELPISTIFLNLQRNQFSMLIKYCWWTLWHLTGYVLLPCFVIKIFFRQNIRSYGLGFGDLHQHWRWYLALLSPILVLVALASFRADFVNHYPFYKQASRSIFDFLCWEVMYLSQFVFLEFFFRGFILQALRPALGANAVLIMCVPYLMIHFPKPWLEATGAIFFGLFLGILSLRSRSIWGGVAVHTGVALSMDIIALLQKDALPTRWQPF
ncbi:CPBP family intramembrane metalloprotease [Desulfococcaceae bacterium HSG9]|nr:CPBP family intramembrane metalloprotease [Desulfococcaceae bacterium HSG9]